LITNSSNDVVVDDDDDDVLVLLMDVDCVLVDLHNKSNLQKEKSQRVENTARDEITLMVNERVYVI
jgi:hypothetical protein